VTLSKFVGHHTVKAGGEYRRMTADALTYGNSAGNFGSRRASPRTEHEYGQLDRRRRLRELSPGVSGDRRYRRGRAGNFLLNYYAGYVQDEFRATSNLTFNLGLRYEFEDACASATTVSPSASTPPRPSRCRSRVSTSKAA